MKNHSLLAVVGVLAVSSVAYAERRQNTLATDVAVRHRRLLVKNRFEFAPLFESTINADFRHIIGGGIKLEYHFSDMISIGGASRACASSGSTPETSFVESHKSANITVRNLRCGTKGACSALPQSGQ